MACPEILNPLKYIPPLLKKPETHLQISGSLVKTWTNPINLEMKTLKSIEERNLSKVTCKLVTHTLKRLLSRFLVKKEAHPAYFPPHHLAAYTLSTEYFLEIFF